MKTLEEHQKERLDANQEILKLNVKCEEPIQTLETNQTIKKSDIRCPKCPDGEFYYLGNTVLLSSPPQRNVKCNFCDYRTLIYA
jgi:DNA-directed RNA polymerase subunit RPC12/RpoP